MRTGLVFFAFAVAISVVVHLMALLGVALSAKPKPFAAVPVQSVTVDIVSPDEVPQAPEAPKEALLPTQAQSPKAAVPPQAAQAEPPRRAAQPPKAAEPPKAAQAPRQSPPPAGTAQAPEQPTRSQQPPSQQPPSQQPADQSMFDPAKLAAMFPVSPVAPMAETAMGNFSGFDAPADKAANLSAADVAAFRAHLRKCMTLPAGVTAAEKLRVVLRVALKPDGALRAQPTLIEASASPNGPALVDSVVRALRQCQPYNFLPADKYAEWKILDLSFTPRDMAGG